MELPKPIFIDADADTIIKEMTTEYEALTNRKLQPGQAETLLIQSFAAREQLLRIGINEAGRQNLVSFARYPALDFLGEIVGVVRLPAQPAKCLMRLTLIAGHGGILIPEGLRIQSVDGKAIFQLIESKTVQAAFTTVDITAQCTVDGSVGNGYVAGEVAIILDPQPYLTSAENVDITAGGADQESDEELRERIRLAPSQFSVAGPEDAYKFFAKSAHPLIIDVAVTSPVPGQVNIYPLLLNGENPTQEIIDAVFASCNADKRRPLTDTVVVQAPTNVNYAITVNLTLLNDAVSQTTVDMVTANLEAYRDARKSKLGVDTVISQLIGQCMVPGVYKAVIGSPVADVVLQPNEYGNCTGITVNVVGASDE